MWSSIMVHAQSPTHIISQFHRSAGYVNKYKIAVKTERTSSHHDHYHALSYPLNLHCHDSCWIHFVRKPRQHNQKNFTELRAKVRFHKPISVWTRSCIYKKWTKELWKNEHKCGLIISIFAAAPCHADRFVFGAMREVSMQSCKRYAFHADRCWTHCV